MDSFFIDLDFVLLYKNAKKKNSASNAPPLTSRLINNTHCSRGRKRCLKYTAWIPKLHKKPYKERFIAGSSSCTTTKLSKLITGYLQLVKCHCTAYCKTTRERTGVNCMWIINNSLDVLNTLEEKQLSLTKMSTWDFSTLYTSLATTCQT